MVSTQHKHIANVYIWFLQVEEMMMLGREKSHIIVTE